MEPTVGRLRKTLALEQKKRALMIKPWKAQKRESKNGLRHSKKKKQWFYTTHSRSEKVCVHNLEVSQTENRKKINKCHQRLSKFGFFPHTYCFFWSPVIHSYIIVKQRYYTQLIQKVWNLATVFLFPDYRKKCFKVSIRDKMASLSCTFELHHCISNALGRPVNCTTLHTVK